MSKNKKVTKTARKVEVAGARRMKEASRVSHAKVYRKSKMADAGVGNPLTTVQKRYLSIQPENFFYQTLLPYHTDVVRRVPDKDLTTLMKIEGFQPGALLLNLGQYLALKNRGRIDELVNAYKELAAAVRRGEKTFLGRKIRGWFTESRQWTESRRRAQHRKDLLDNPVFQDQFADIKRAWPRNLKSFANTSIPSPYSFLMDPRKGMICTEPEELYYEAPAAASASGGSSTAAGDADLMAFRPKVRDFLRTWKLAGIVYERKTKQHSFLLPVLCFSCDVDGQGTYVFLPPGYTYAAIRKGAKEEFKPLQDVLADNYEAIEPGKRTLREKKKDCLAYVRQQLGGEPPTRERVEQLAREWCRTKVKFHGIEYPRITSDSGERIYVKSALHVILDGGTV